MQPSSLHKQWHKARAQVEGMESLRWHDLRHFSATTAAQTGASLAELQRRLGHSTVNAAMRYQHAAQSRDGDIAAAMSLLATGTTPAPEPPAPAPEPAPAAPAANVVPIRRPEVLVPLTEARKRLGLSGPAALRRLIDAGYLRAVQRYGREYVTEASMVAYVAEVEAEAAESDAQWERLRATRDLVR
jgi:hypothetical protein